MGNAIISEEYLPAFEEESIERLRYFAPWLSFEPFFRVDKSRSRELGGVGLGLALVNEIVRVHDGSIAIRPNPSGGTIIKCSLQLTEQQLKLSRHTVYLCAEILHMTVL